MQRGSPWAITTGAQYVAGGLRRNSSPSPTISSTRRSAARSSITSGRICACTPRYPNAPAEHRGDRRARRQDDQGRKNHARRLRGQHVDSVNQPHPASITDQASLLPAQTLPTIGDRLIGEEVGWAWYSGGWNDALAGTPRPDLPVPSPALRLFRQLRRRHRGKREHLKDETDFFAAIDAGGASGGGRSTSRWQRQRASRLRRRHVRRPPHRPRSSTRSGAARIWPSMRDHRHL